VDSPPVARDNDRSQGEGMATEKNILEIRHAPITLRRIMKVVDQIVAKFSPRKVILFGSRATGKARRHSDVDLLVITEKRTDCRTSVRIRMAIDYDFPLDLVVWDSRRLEERIQAHDWFLIEAMEQGKVLYDRHRR
jgi:predicted nucleotidyltransferase